MDSENPYKIQTTIYTCNVGVYTEQIGVQWKDVGCLACPESRKLGLGYVIMSVMILILNDSLVRTVNRYDPRGDPCLG